MLNASTTWRSACVLCFLPSYLYVCVYGGGRGVERGGTGQGGVGGDVVHIRATVNVLCLLPPSVQVLLSPWQLLSRDTAVFWLCLISAAWRRYIDTSPSLQN